MEGDEPQSVKLRQRNICKRNGLTLIQTKQRKEMVNEVHWNCGFTVEKSLLVLPPTASRQYRAVVS